jgi:molecular chaperone GrpE (heat shock protein)
MLTRVHAGRIEKGALSRWQRKQKPVPKRRQKRKPGRQRKAENPKTEEKEEKKKKREKAEKIPKEDYDRLQAEFDSHKQQYLRVLAEYDNFRKRSQNEKNGVYNNAISDAVNAILPVADNIDRALAQENASAEDMRKGVEMIANQFKACFEKLGITEIRRGRRNVRPEFPQCGFAYRRREPRGERHCGGVPEGLQARG